MTVVSKKIWIINQYGSLPSTGIGGRHRHLSRELTRLGYKVTLISARWSHLDTDEERSNTAPDIEIFEGFRFIRIPVFKYKHAHDKKRILNWFAFAWRIRRLASTHYECPDVIIYSSPSLIAYLAAYGLAKKHNARLIFEVRDIWPLTLMQIGGFSSKHPFIRFMQWVEDLAYKRSDFVISNIEGAVQHMSERGLSENKFAWIPNGYSEDELNDVEPADYVIANSINAQHFSITYAGAIGEANSLVTLLEAAELVKGNNEIHFNIVGRGRLADELKMKAKHMNLGNVHFYGAVPKKQVQSILRASDACIICWKDTVLYEYGVAANKLFDYLYSGCPVINAYSGGYDLIERYKAGVTVDAENPKALADAILELSQESEKEREGKGRNGKIMVSRYHEYAQIAQRLAKVVESLL